MLRFKQFIRENYLEEATAKHFSNINLDPENPEHKDLIDAYNSAHSQNDPDVPRHPGQIKTIEQLRNSVKPHLEKIKQKRKEDADDKAAFESGDAKLIHHNPNTGVKVYQVKNQKGSCAAGASSTWCTGQRSKADMVNHYDPEGNNSFVFHFPKEKKKNLRKIGAYGEYSENERKPTENFQDAENHNVSNEDWNRLKKEHNLDKVKELRGNVRGIDLTEKDKDQYSKELNNKIKNKTANDDDIKHAFKHQYLNIPKTHISPALDNKSSAVKLAAFNSDNITSDHIDKALNDSDWRVRHTAIKHPNATSDHIEHVLRHDSDTHVRQAALSHKNATKEQVSKAFDLNAPTLDKFGAITNPNLAHEHISKSLNHPDSSIRRFAIRHPNATSDDIAHVLKYESDGFVRNEALKNPNATEKQLSTAINSNLHMDKSGALKNPNLTREHISKLLQDNNSNIRLHTVNHKNITHDQLVDASKDEDFEVREAAKDRLKNI